MKEWEEHTVAIIKPGFTKHTGQILAEAEGAFLYVDDLVMRQFPRTKWEFFYAEHKGKEFFEGLVDYMSSGPVVVALLRGEKAIERWRKCMGDTDPSKAAPYTLRQVFGRELPKNVVHGSDSPEAVEREKAIFSLRPN